MLLSVTIFFHCANSFAMRARKASGVLPTGVLAGLLCLWLWPVRGTPPLLRRSQGEATRPRLALGYFAGAMLCLLIAMQGGWTMFAAWPTAALALVAVNYADQTAERKAA